MVNKNLRAQPKFKESPSLVPVRAFLKGIYWRGEVFKKCSAALACF